MQTVKPSLNVKEIAKNYIYDFEVINGTSFILLHWVVRSKACFAIIDEQYKPVWYKNFNSDYVVKNDNRDRDLRDKLKRKIYKKGAIIKNTTAHQFSIYSAKNSEKITYKITKDKETNKVAVREISREKYDQHLKEKKPIAHSFSKINPKIIEKIVLEKNQTKSSKAKENTINFGNYCKIKSEKRKILSLDLISQEGKILKSIAFPNEYNTEKQKKTSNIINIGKEEFLFARSDYGRYGKARLFKVDFGYEKISEIVDFDCPYIEKIRAFGNGDFVALATEKRKYTWTSSIYSFTKSGKLIWKVIEGENRRQDSEIFSPKDICTYKDEFVVVLDNVRDTLQFFTRAGKFEKKIDLEKTWGREPNYPSGISEDIDGGLIIYYFNAKNKLVRIDETGAIKSEFSPKFKNGTPIRIFSLIFKNKNLWIGDRHSYINLNSKGKVTISYGNQFDEEILKSPSIIDILQNGGMYIKDTRTKTIHIFSSKGKKNKLIKLSPKKFNKKLKFREVIVDSQGLINVYIGKKKYLKINRENEIVKEFTLDFDTITQNLYFKNRNKGLIIKGYRDLYLLNNEFKLQKTISRGANDIWLKKPHDISIASDNTFTVNTYKQKNELNIYSAVGEHSEAFTYSPDWGYYYDFAYSSINSTVYFLNETDDDLIIYIYKKTKDKYIPHGKFNLSEIVQADASIDKIFLQNNNEEIWLFDNKNFTLYKISTKL